MSKYVVTEEFLRNINPSYLTRRSGRIYNIHPLTPAQERAGELEVCVEELVEEMELMAERYSGFSLHYKSVLEDASILLSGIKKAKETAEQEGDGSLKSDATKRAIIHKQAQQIIRLTRAVDHLGTELDTARLEVAGLEQKMERLDVVIPLIFEGGKLEGFHGGDYQWTQEDTEQMIKGGHGHYGFLEREDDELERETPKPMREDME